MPSRASTRRPLADLVADIYDAALDPDGWPRFAAPFAEALGRKSAFLWIGDSGGIVEGVTYGLPDAAFENYVTYYSQVDIWAAAARDRPPQLKAVVASALVPERRFLDSEFYFDYARVHDTV